MRGHHVAEFVPRAGSGEHSGLLWDPLPARGSSEPGSSQPKPRAACQDEQFFLHCLLPGNSSYSRIWAPLWTSAATAPNEMLCLYQHSVKKTQENLESRSRSEEQRAASHPHIQKDFRENPASTKKLGAHCRAAEQLVHNLPAQKAQRALAAFGEGKQRVGRMQEQLRGCAALQGWGSGSAQTRGREQDEQRDPSCKLWKTASGKQTVPVCGVWESRAGSYLPRADLIISCKAYSGKDGTKATQILPGNFIICSFIWLKLL